MVCHTRCCIGILLLMLMVRGLSAQERAPHLQHLTIEDGLSQSAIFALMQDRQGFIWIGTKDGLNQYDGYHFTVFQHNPFDSTTLSSNFVTAIFEDSRGYLWVGTREGGLNRMDRNNEQFRHYRHNSQHPGSPSDNRITAITEDKSGTLWIGTVRELNRLPGKEIEKKSPVFQKLAHDPQNPHSLSHNSVEALLVDSEGFLWVGTRQGLNRLNLSQPARLNFQFDRFDAGPPGSGKLLDDCIFSIYQSARGTIWVGTISGLNRLQKNSHTFTQFPNRYHIYRKGWGAISDMEEDPTGKLWLTTPDELMIFNPATGQYQTMKNDPLNPASLSSNGLSRIIRDRSDVLWIGTNGYGLNLFDTKAERFFTYRRPRNFKSRISRFSITAILEDNQENLWIGADVLYRWNRHTGNLISFETDSHHPRDFGNTGIWSMVLDENGMLWAAGYEGLYRYTLTSGTYRHFTARADSNRGLMEKVALNVFLDRDGFLWVATENYFSRYNTATDRFTHYRYRRRPATRAVSFTDTYQDREGIFWLATDGGLVRFDPKTEIFRYYVNNPADSNSLSNNVVLSICESVNEPEKILWLGTAGGGLNRFYKKEERFDHITETQGLPNNVIYGILPDELGNLWLSTNRGVSRFTPATGEIRNFDVNDGLQSNEFNTGAYFKSRSGEMFFGGIQGLTYFFPARIMDNPHIPNVVITGLRIFNREVTPEIAPDVLQKVITRSKEITLSYRQNVVTFEFAALDYSTSSRNQYAYKMEGFNDDWIFNGVSRNATFTNLPPGKYIFRVKGSNNDGIWNENGASLIVMVAPPPWRTWWAYLFYGMAILGALYGIRRYELNRIRLKNRLKVEQVAGDKLRELDQMRTQFFANISHEFRTPLTLILGQIDRVLSTASNREEKNRLEIALRNAHRLLRLINQLLDLSRLEAGSMPLKAVPANIIPFLKNVFYAFESLAEEKHISLEFHCSRHSIRVNYEPDKLEKVFFNLLANALKFTPEGGKIEVAVDSSSKPSQPLLTAVPDYGTKFIEIMVKDTGIGIPAEQLPHIFNRFYQVDSTSTREQEGSGIGLALAKELVELHGGEIGVVSKESEGTTFTVRLPLELDIPPAPPLKGEIGDSPIGQVGLRIPQGGRSDLEIEPFEQTAASEIQHLITNETTRQNTANHKSATRLSTSDIVLIVEDNPDVRAYIYEQLITDYRVLEAENGEEGLKRAREEIPDLIITDVMMPKMDGYQLTGILKKDEKTCHIPIIMLTARAGLDDKIAGLETGADDYLLKPFSARELTVRVANLIDLRCQLRKRFKQQTVVKPEEITAIPMDQAFLEKVLGTIEQEMSEEVFDVNSLANSIGMSISQLNRKLRALIDQPAGHLLRSMRLQRAADLLKQNTGTVAEICYQVGFGDQANFTRAFKKQFGVAPGMYRKGSKRWGSKP